MAHRVYAPKIPYRLKADGRQAGVSLMMVLICLAIMSLAAVGLIRMVDSGSMIVGNVAFKQSATSAADRGTELAVIWLQRPETTSGTVLFNDRPGDAYYATSLNALDPSGNGSGSTRVLVNWEGAPCSGASCISPSRAEDINGYRVQYVITRLCKEPGDPNSATNSCSKPMNTGSAGPSEAVGSIDYRNYERFVGGPPGPFYRIVVRSAGPRNTVSLTETYVYF